MDTVLLLNVTLLVIAGASWLGSKSFVQSVFQRTAIGSLRVEGPSSAFRSGTAVSGEKDLSERAAVVRERLVTDFVYILDLATAYVVFCGGAVAGLLTSYNGLRVTYVLGSILCIVLWRFHAEGLGVAGYYSLRAKAVSWYRLQIIVSILLNSSGAADHLVGRMVEMSAQ